MAGTRRGPGKASCITLHERIEQDIRRNLRRRLDKRHVHGARTKKFEGEGARQPGNPELDMRQVYLAKKERQAQRRRDRLAGKAPDADA